MNSQASVREWAEAWGDFMRLHLLQQRRCKRRVWVRPHLLDRDQQAGRLLGRMMEEELDCTVINFMRMQREDFQYILSLVTPSIQRQDTYMRDAITARDKLIITLRYLAAGDDYKSLEYAYKVSAQSISLFIPQVCGSLIGLLRAYVKIPSSNEEWLQISQEFQAKGNFPHVIGAIDGKHVRIKAPRNSGTDYFNYKQFFSIVLLAVVDANGNFMFADVGAKGWISDGGVFRHSRLHNLLENKLLNIPEPQTLGSDPSTPKVPYMLLGDKAFALTEYCIRPFAGTPDEGTIQRIFNDKHSAARRVVEQAFGILSSRFRVLQTVIELEPNVAIKIVLACIYLHNFIRRHQSTRSFDQAMMTNNRRSNRNPYNFTELRGVTTRTSDQLMRMRLYVANYLANNV